MTSISRTTIYVFPDGMGDAIMALAVAYNYFKQKHQPFHIAHKDAFLFQNISYIVCHPEYSFWRINEHSSSIANQNGFELISLNYFDFRQVHSSYWHYYGNNNNLIEQLCSQVGLSGEIITNPSFPLTPEDLKFESLAKGKIAIISTGTAIYKSFPFERMQQIIDSFPDNRFFQLGKASDPLFSHVEDFRGKFTIREIAGLLHNARLFLGPIGGIMHLARSVDCPALILLPSFESSNWHYKEYDYISPLNNCNECVVNKTNPGSCTHPNTCMDITVEQVVHKLQSILSSERKVLATESSIIKSSPASGLELRQKMVSFLANHATIRVYDEKLLSLSIFKLQLDKRVFRLRIPLKPFSKEIIIHLPRIFTWLYEIKSISIPSINKEISLVSLFSQYRLYGCNTCNVQSQFYVYPYKNIGKICIPIHKLLSSFEENPKDIELIISIQCIPFEAIFSNKPSILSKGWRLRLFPMINYLFEHLLDAFRHDSLSNITSRIYNASIRILKH